MEKTEEKILYIIKSNPYVTDQELAEAHGLAENVFYRSVKQLRGQELLRCIGGRKEEYWQMVTR